MINEDPILEEHSYHEPGIGMALILMIGLLGFKMIVLMAMQWLVFGTTWPL